MTKILGQDLDVVWNQILALVMNISSWLTSLVLGPAMIDQTAYMAMSNPCVEIDGPGGLDRLQVKEIPGSEGTVRATVGYNVPGFKAPYAQLSLSLKDFPKGMVLVRVSHFSINYADVTIRWGLYESALRYVGWPIVPGFDFSGRIEFAPKDCDYKVGDEVFGFTLFGAYSSQILCPVHQLRKKPKVLSMPAAAATPAVSATALHAIALAGGWPNPPKAINKAALVHSAAGGVGTKLLQMLRICGFSPIVGVVGASNKVSACKRLGADVVIDKSTEDLWAAAEAASPGGYAAIFDANGVSTLRDSYDHLCRSGKLVTYGFHSNIPKASQFISPLEWLKIVCKMAMMPKFDPLDMVLTSKTISGFNLSFFADEVELINVYMNQLLEWIGSGKLTMDDVTCFNMNEVGLAHNFIQSGKSIGKIVVKVPQKTKSKST
jgi:2-desacetyl-2-hydroxyethyl bacteriochlorophyllide A dehydrogenase